MNPHRKRGQKMKPVAKQDAGAVYDALPIGAKVALAHAGQGGWVSSIGKEDLASGIAWAVVELTPGGRKFHPTELGRRVLAIADHRAAIAKKPKGDAA